MRRRTLAEPDPWPGGMPLGRRHAQASFASGTAAGGILPRAGVFRGEGAAYPATSILFYTQVAEAGIDVRRFASQHGIAEDPATGNADVALIGLLARLRPETALRLARTIARA